MVLQIARSPSQLHLPGMVIVIEVPPACESLFRYDCHRPIATGTGIAITGYLNFFVSPSRYHRRNVMIPIAIIASSQIESELDGHRSS